MKKIDWYILRKFLGTFFYAILLFIVISVVIDITEKINDFIGNHLSIYEIIFKYYIGFIPYIAALLFPLFIFLSVIFFTSKMAYRTEIVAILSSGVSFNRFLRAYWVGAILLALLLGCSNQLVIPVANRVRTAFENKYINNKRMANAVNNVHLRIDTLSYITMNTYFPIDKYASGFLLDKIRADTLLSVLEASTLTWDSSGKDWKASQAIVRDFHGLRQTVRLVPDTALKLALEPGDLIRENNIIESMTTPELNRFIARQRLRGAEGLNYLYVEKYRRTASAFAVVILSLIGVAIASRKIRGGSGLHLALGIVISSAYIIFMQFSTTFSVKGNLPPLLSVWIPNFIFAGVAFWLYRKAPK